MRVRNLVKALSAALLVVACNGIFGVGSDYHLVESKDASSNGCTSKNDCANGELCLFASCVHTCTRDGDCPAGWRCLDTAQGAACVTPSLASCVGNACPDGTTCHDGQCRSPCTDSAACASDQTCTAASVCIGTLTEHDPPPKDAGGAGGDGSVVASGGSQATGGTAAEATGGTPSTGGTSVASGGAAAGTGGVASGGTVGAGGTLAASGGTVATGGTVAASGGTVATGGTTAANGGTVGTGGTTTSTGGVSGVCSPSCSGADPICLSGTCVECSPPDGQCVVNQPQKCSTLGHWSNQPLCTAAAPTCSAGECICTNTLCSNKCVDTATDSFNCGTCGHICSTANTNGTSCSGSACAPQCTTGFKNCGTPTTSADDGCECAGTACCGTACQTKHSNGAATGITGFGVSYYDCSSGIDATSALDACQAFLANAGGTTYSIGYTCNLTQCATGACLHAGSDPAAYCWGYVSTLAGKVYEEFCPEIRAHS